MYIVNVDKPTRKAVLHLIDSPDKRCWQRDKNPTDGFWTRVDSELEARRISDRHCVKLHLCQIRMCLKGDWPTSDR